ncbi:uncharacterized protein OCT59_005949 [Rhizophagus irregularis]|uniref:uncharacterized protein n=1 Tax=Rhizophagus irregularis TaxID=588596 RepID=UPI003320AB28|nr:hypothetical protein OCT59_005949 [Rhizophagus irregularis]
MTLNFQSCLFKDISSMLKNADDYNVIIKVGKSQDIKEFRAHSNILRSHSQHFKNVIPADINKKNTIFTIIKPNITPTIFEIILKYIYTGEFNFKNKSGTDSFKLLVACSNLLLEELVEYLQSFLIEQHSSWIRQNFVLVLNAIFKSPILKKLQDYFIIPINLYDEILEYHLVIKPKLCIYNSKIIKPKLVNVFINWIDKELKDPIYIRNEYDPIYKFKLIYHGKPNEILSNNNNNNNSSNEDSFANLILIKTKGSNTKNFGGYNSHDLKVNCKSYEKDLCTSTYKIEEIEAYNVTKFI